MEENGKQSPLRSVWSPEADLYLLDEPSARTVTNARMEAAKAIRRTMEANEKSAFVIVDVYFIDIVSSSLLVFEGQGGVEGRATGPYRLEKTEPILGGCGRHVRAGC